jgi:hypothetical protein
MVPIHPRPVVINDDNKSKDIIHADLAKVVTKLQSKRTHGTIVLMLIDSHHTWRYSQSAQAPAYAITLILLSKPRGYLAKVVTKLR